ncbi:coiled-coil domain-containing protein 7 [Dermatophagoides farinae]|uniref:Coiled-coil domain-containing protein 7 n=1 Tax=Dermatophagoides farinae TaxID=6954 RepID=A0A9D4SDN2_DERFA|nr:coiled-coil domain-containing protein 7 [Dermatophagoides farinae]
MEVGNKKLRSIFKQVQSSAKVLSTGDRPRLSSVSSPNSVCHDEDGGKPTIDLSTAIEYNYCLINSYVQERCQRTLSPYEEMVKTFTSAEDEDGIIESIGSEFFLDPSQPADHQSPDCDELEFDRNNNDLLEQAKIMEKCVLSKLPPLSQADELLNYIELEKKKLTGQQTIVSKRLTEMILANDGHFQSELARVRCIEQDLATAIHTCVDGRRAFRESKRNFTQTSMTIIDNHRLREAIIQIIDCLQAIKRLRETVERIDYMLQYEKNFSTAIDLLDKQMDILESLSEKYSCVAEMRDRLLVAIQLVGDQMDAVLAKMCDRFCVRTYRQLVKAYSQIGKTESSLQQLQLHFVNTIHDKAFGIVLESSFKRKPLAELCQHLNPESFLQCLIDMCRALWDVMYNYHQCLAFYQRQPSSLTKEEIDLAVKKLSHGALRVWSDVQHKVRILLTSVKFVHQQPGNHADLMHSDAATNQPPGDDVDQITHHHHHQDQLLFSFEEFIKILSVSERMIEIGKQFCQLYQLCNHHRNELLSPSASPTMELESTLYQQTRAYVQSYHQVSMFELKIFLENEIWTRCPIETTDEFELIANLQEFAFIKQRLLRMKIHEGQCSTGKKDKLTKASPSTLLLSPVASGTTRACYFVADDLDADDDVLSLRVSVSPFDELITRDTIISQQTFDSDSDRDDDRCDIRPPNDSVSSSKMEIVTTNTALNVVRLMGRYMNIMFLLRPISHDIIQALLELFDYYLYVVYHFFAKDALPVSWLVVNQLSTPPPPPSSQSNRLQLNHKLSLFIKRINETLISNNGTFILKDDEIGSANCSPSKAAWSMPKYPCPDLSEYVPIQLADRHYALGERIMAIQSMIFIGRQFYHLCPLLLEFLRPDDEQDDDESSWSLNAETSKMTKDGFIKGIQFYHDKMWSSVASLQYQCLYAVVTKLLPYETIVQQMQQTRWDLKEIPSIHSPYVNVIVEQLNRFDAAYGQLLHSHDLTFLTASLIEDDHVDGDDDDGDGDDDDEDGNIMPLTKLEWLSRRIPITLWECLLRALNRTFIEGFSTVRKCTNEGRALMQLDYEQFLSHMEKLMTPCYYYYYYTNQQTAKSSLKSYLANERLQVEEYIKAFYITESTFADWIRQKSNVYTGKQIVSLITCIAGDNKKLQSSLLSVIDASSLEHSQSAPVTNE